jgi:predicted HTH domain antitoxin
MLLPRNAVIPAPVTSQRKVGHSLPIGHIFHFRVTAQITNDDEFLIHVSLSLNLNLVDKKLISFGAIAPLAGPTSPFAFLQRLAQAKKKTATYSEEQIAVLAKLKRNRD